MNVTELLVVRQLWNWLSFFSCDNNYHCPTRNHR
jgi:hypothetical protein